MQDVQSRIEQAAKDATFASSPDARLAVDELLLLLERGEVRAAIRDATGKWNAVTWVKQGILLGFRIGKLIDMSPVAVPDSQEAEFSYFDKDTYPLRELRSPIVCELSPEDHPFGAGHTSRPV